MMNHYLVFQRKSNQIILLVIAVLLFGCASSKLAKQEKGLQERLSLDYKVKSIDVIDERQEVNEYDIFLPVISSPGQDYQARPPFINQHKILIENTVMGNCQETGEEMHFRIYIIDAYKHFLANGFSETERAWVKVKIELIKERDVPVKECFSQASFSWSSMDAKHMRMERMYRLCLQKAVYSCLQKFKEEESSNLMSPDN